MLELPRTGPCREKLLELKQLLQMRKRTPNSGFQESRQNIFGVSYVRDDSKNPSREVTTAKGTPLSTESLLFDGVHVQMATVKVEGPKRWHRAIPFIHQGSNITLARSELAQNLRLEEIGTIQLKLQEVGHLHRERE